jgi:hypothetical protein
LPNLVTRAIGAASRDASGFFATLRMPTWCGASPSFSLTI